MEITLTNTFFQATVSRQGAQLISFKNLSTGVEHIWNGNSQVWKFRAPILFPIVGRLKDGFYQWQGKQYLLTNHGFARDLEHELVESSGTKVLWRLTDCEYTRKIFPGPLYWRQSIVWKTPPWYFVPPSSILALQSWPSA